MKQVIQVTPAGEQHGLINVLANSVANNDFKYMDPSLKAKAEKEKKEDAKMVKAQYLNSRGNNERLTKPYCRWAGDPIQIWHFIPGKTYEVPLGLINEVNSKKNISRAGKCDESGENPQERDQEEEPLHRFVPVGF